MSTRVLYVEDEPDIRTLVEFALEDEGFQLVPCASGQEALVRAQDGPFDLLLIDVMMPGMDGPTTLRALRDLDPLKAVPAVFMTAKVQPAEIRAYLEMGAVGVIPKPFKALTLGTELRALLEATGHGR